jgi:hypothetical protein
MPAFELTNQGFFPSGKEFRVRVRGMRRLVRPGSAGLDSSLADNIESFGGAWIGCQFLVQLFAVDLFGIESGINELREA